MYELSQDIHNLEFQLENLKLLGSKGTTGTQASFMELFSGDEEKVKRLEELIAADLGFNACVPVSGQTYSRKTDSYFLSVLSGFAQSAYKFSNDMRLLQSFEEMEEPFGTKQIGSSAMPYKRNPMRCERICALARYVMVDVGNPAMTAATQWFERTLDDSANKRLSVPEAVRDDALTYLRVYLLGMPFIAIYNFLAAVMRSQGDTQTPLWALVAATLVNIAGNLFFVLVFGMGTAGVALATVLANALAASLLFFSLITADGPLHIEPREVFRIDMTALRPMVRIGWPAGLQGAVFSISNLVIQSAINSLGADAMAGSVAAFTIEINIYCFINAFGLAATTFVSQNYGAKNLERCKRATYVATGLNMVATVLMVALVLVFGRTMLGLFTDVPAVVELAMARIFWVASFEPISVLMEVSSSAMRGYGYSMPPAMATLICVCSVRLIWVWTVFAASPDYVTLMIVYPISWAVTVVPLLYLYVRLMKRIKRRFEERALEAEAA